MVEPFDDFAELALDGVGGPVGEGGKGGFEGGDFLQGGADAWRGWRGCSGLGVEFCPLLGAQLIVDFSWIAGVYV